MIILSLRAENLLKYRILRLDELPEDPSAVVGCESFVDTAQPDETGDPLERFVLLMDESG